MAIISFLDNKLYFDDSTKKFSLSPDGFSHFHQVQPSIDEIIPYIKPTSYSFCLEISNACNLSCDYCFNKNKNQTTLSLEKAIKQLDILFNIFSNGEKYFVDLSGKGEPLLNLKTIIGIAEYCHMKSDELRVEIIPMLVCNGTLLTPSAVKILQKHGILFGVSIDGNKIVHNSHRKTKLGHPTFDEITNNISLIEGREYVGCAATLTNDAFDLDESIFALSQTFKTLSYRFARGNDFAIDDKTSILWIKEYDKLASHLLLEAENGNLKQWFCLLNGDDYFGRFLSRAILKRKTINRCDGGISRFSIDENDKIYHCSAATCVKDLAITENLKEQAAQNLYKQAHQCEECLFKFYCGGECPIELKRLGHPNESMCALTKHIIELAFYLALTLEKECRNQYTSLVEFLNEKQNRFHINEELLEFIGKNPSLTFSEAKREFDALHKKY